MQLAMANTHQDSINDLYNLVRWKLALRSSWFFTWQTFERTDH